VDGASTKLPVASTMLLRHCCRYGQGLTQTLLTCSGWKPVCQSNIVFLEPDRCVRWLAFPTSWVWKFTLSSIDGIQSGWQNAKIRCDSLNRCGD